MEFDGVMVVVEMFKPLLQFNFSIVPYDDYVIDVAGFRGYFLNISFLSSAIKKFA